MKTFLGYLTFTVLLVLCYLEKINAEDAKNQARVRAAGHHLQKPVSPWVGQQVRVARLGQ